MQKRSERQVRAIGAQFRAEEQSEAKTIAGYFAVFGETYEIWPGVTESIDSRAFENALDDDVRALIDHETRLVLGRTGPGTLKLRTDGKGLWGEIIVNPDDTDAMNLYARVRRGDVSQCSFGFDILDEEKSIDANTGDVHYTIRAVKLYEVSVCTFPAYKQTEVEARAEARKEQKKRQVDAWRENMRRRLNHGA